MGIEEGVLAMDTETRGKPDGRGAYDAMGLAGRLGVSRKWVQKHTHRLPGRMKVGRMVRYDSAAVERAILSGQVLKGGV